MEIHLFLIYDIVRFYSSYRVWFIYDVATAIHHADHAWSKL